MSTKRSHILKQCMSPFSGHQAPKGFKACRYVNKWIYRNLTNSFLQYQDPRNTNHDQDSNHADHGNENSHTQVTSKDDENHDNKAQLTNLKRSKRRSAVRYGFP